ncbi:hypothetical protein ABZ215_36705 [Amycolatopsis sp. NPDC006131]|uniref:hypothetical protein n=1 Tax=Amycolatopsis sp. NPDC006131 TaxID=3156731 RepID=UPI0033B0EFDA
MVQNVGSSTATIASTSLRGISSYGVKVRSPSGGTTRISSVPSVYWTTTVLSSSASTSCGLRTSHTR